MGWPSRCFRWWQHGQRDWAFAGRCCHRAVWPAQRGVVCVDCHGGHRVVVGREPVVCRAPKWPPRHAACRWRRFRRTPRVWCGLPSACCWCLFFPKYFYIAGLSTFYTFYLIEKFGMSVQSAQVHLFIFLFASAIGTLAGGPIGDRIGRKPVIWASILGVAPRSRRRLFWTTFAISFDWPGAVVLVLGHLGLRARTHAGATAGRRWPGQPSAGLAGAPWAPRSSSPWT